MKGYPRGEIPAAPGIRIAPVPGVIREQAPKQVRFLLGCVVIGILINGVPRVFHRAVKLGVSWPGVVS